MKKIIKSVMNQFKVGNIVEGRVIKIKKNEIWVDLDGKAVGVIRGPQIGNEKKLAVGDKIMATIIEEENELGVLELSTKEISGLKVWEELKKIKENKETIKVKVIEANKGGLIVEYKKLQGFIPSSQLASDHYPQVEDKNKDKILDLLKRLIGKVLEVKVLSLNKKDKKIIFSEKETELEKRKISFKKYKVGDIVEGRVVAFSPFGVFFEFNDGLKGLVHISELSWQKVEKIEDVVKIGEKRKAKILSFDNSKISLSFKRLTPDPWQEIEKKYKVGETVLGKISKITPYGVFVELDKNIQGLAHISEIPEDQKNEIKVGNFLKFKIISLEPEDHRLGLSLKL